MTLSSAADPVLPFIAADPMQAVIESDGATAWNQQRAQERLDAEWERTPANERPLFPPTYFPDPLTSPGGAPHQADAPDDPPPPGASATVPTTTSLEQ